MLASRKKHMRITYPQKSTNICVSQNTNCTKLSSLSKIIIPQILKSKRVLIYSYIYNKKKDLLNKIKADEFPKPKSSRNFSKSLGSDMLVGSQHRIKKKKSLLTIDIPSCESTSINCKDLSTHNSNQSSYGQNEQKDQVFCHGLNDINNALYYLITLLIKVF